MRNKTFLHTEKDKCEGKHQRSKEDKNTVTF